jgi:hypothetical protein
LTRAPALPPLVNIQYRPHVEKRDCLMRFKWAEKGKTMSPAQIELVF